jgi:ribosomal subunit interface protein
MSISISGRHVEISDAFREHVVNGLKGLWEKHHLSPVEAHVLLSKEGPFFICDISAKLGKKSSLRCQGQGDKGYSSFDNALMTLTQRLRRHRKKVKDLHHHKGHSKISSLPLYVLNGSASHEEIEKDQEDEHTAAIIAEIKTEVPLLSVSEAVMELDLNDQEAFVFRNKTHNKINMIYRGRDGHIGWIDPEVAQ